jgi:hypothetical protein
VRDLSIGGARLVGPSLAPGTKLNLSLSLPTGAFNVGAVVLRQDGDWDRKREALKAIAIAFEHPSPDVEDVIEDMVCYELSRERGQVALVIDTEHSSNRRLFKSLHRLGSKTIVVRTSLQAISCLENPNLSISTVFLSPGLDHVDGADFAAFLADAYPRVRRVLMAGQKTSVRDNRVNAVLSQPITASAVAKVIGR